jgi:DUF1680 family protein
VHPDPRIDAVRGTVAVEAGPLVYCLEHLEGSEEPHPDRFWVDATEAPSVAAQTTVGGAPAVVVHGSEATPQPSPWPYAAGAPEEAPTGARREATLIPYALWANRGPSTMRVWLPTS